CARHEIGGVTLEYW
nr:immunoglobulin heavy chain junction region [Macaca mulatta]